MPERTQPRRRARRRRVATLVVTAIMLAAPAGADAYESNWSCYQYGSAHRCFDTDGFHSWIAIQMRVDYFLQLKICAEGWTEAGNVRTGSGCNLNDWRRTSCLSASTPYSKGNGIWYKSGEPNHNMAGYAATPSNNNIC